MINDLGLLNDLAINKLFEGIDLNILKSLDEDSFKRCSFDKNDVLITEDTFGDKVFMLLNGSVRISIADA